MYFGMLGGLQNYFRVKNDQEKWEILMLTDCYD